MTEIELNYDDEINSALIRLRHLLKVVDDFTRGDSLLQKEMAFSPNNLILVIDNVKQEIDDLKLYINECMNELQDRDTER